MDDEQATINRIVQLFKREMREGRPGAVIYPDGVNLDNLPLDPGERVFGVYKDQYFFSPRSLIIKTQQHTDRIPWQDIASCSSEHGCGDQWSTLTMTDETVIRVKLSDLSTGWAGRIGQLYHILVERLGGAIGAPPVPMQSFFDQATQDDQLLPNLVDHPGIQSVKRSMEQLETELPGTRLFMLLAQDELDVGVGIIALSEHPATSFEPFANRFGADGVIDADSRTRRHLLPLPDGYNVWHIVWD